MRFSVDSVFEALARFVIRFRIPVLVLWLAVAAATTAALPSLGSEINSNNSAFLSSNKPSIKAATLAAPLLGSVASGRSAEVTIIAVRSGPLTRDDLAAVGRVASLAREVHHVRSIRELGISADREAFVIRARTRSSGNNISKDKAIVDGLQRAFTRAQPPPGLHLHLAGQVATAVANQRSSNRSGGRIQLFSILFIIVLLLVVFRSVPAALVTLLPSGLALLISMRLIGELGAHGLQISEITEVLLIVLLLGAGTDYGLFLVFRVREELRDGSESHDAVRRALVRVGESISASAGTVILALLTLLLASFGIYHNLGVPLAVGMVVMLVLGLTLLPALLAILGRRAFWPAKVEPGPQREGRWGLLASRVVQRPGLTLGIGVVVFLGLAAGALGYHASGFGGATTAPSGSDAAAGNTALAKHFPQSSSNPANLVFAYQQPVWNNSGAAELADAALRSKGPFATLTGPLDPNAAQTAGAALSSSGAFTTLSGPLDPNGTTLTPAQLAQLHALLGPPQLLSVIEPPGTDVPVRLYNAYRAAAQYVSTDGRTIQFEAALVAGAQDSTAAMNATPKIRGVVARAAAASGAARSGVAGEAAATYDVSTTANSDLVRIIPVAVAAIGLLLALVLRSLVAPLYLIVSVVLSYVAALGVATLAFIDAGGQRGIVFILPFLMFVFLLALGEDYNILVMTRIREEARQLPLREAVVKAIGRTGTTITSAGIILGGTFAVFAIVGGGGSNGGQLRAIGVGLAAGILMDTFLVRTLLVPSAVILLGRLNWWPSSMGRVDRPRGRALRPAPAPRDGRSLICGAMSNRVVLLPGDGIGPEVMAQAVAVLDAVAELEYEEHLFGGASIDAHGTALTGETLEACRRADAVLLAAVGGPKWDTTDAAKPRPEQGLLDLRKGLGLFANLRPVRPPSALYDSSPLKRELIERTDLLVVRELTGGIYFGAKARTRDRALDSSVYTVAEIERIARVAFGAARSRVTSVDKANVLETSRLWREVVHELHGREFPNIELEHLLVDNAAMRLISAPRHFDVILTENLFGDILSDEAAMLTGSIGMLPSASLGDGGPGLFEPVHGSAPDIAGTGAANPLAMFLSAALMLRHGLQMEAHAAAIESAVDKALTQGLRTPDLGGTASTTEATQAVLEHL